LEFPRQTWASKFSFDDDPASLVVRHGQGRDVFEKTTFFAAFLLEPTTA